MQTPRLRFPRPSRAARTTRARVSTARANRFSRRHVLAGSILSLLPALTILSPITGEASNYFWKPSGVLSNGISAFGTVGGAGTWDTTSLNWWDGASFTNSAWNNLGNDTAIFGGTAGTVTLGTGITVGGLQFNTTAYTLNTGANTLSFGAASSPIILNNVAAATITGNVGGSGGVNLFGGVFGGATAGTLTLNGTSTGGWTGATTINNGMTLAMAGANQALNNTSGITLNNGNLSVTNTVAATTTASAGTTASTTVTVASATGIAVGQTLYVAGTSSGATVTNVSGTTITLSSAQTIANGANLGFSTDALQASRINDGAAITSNGGTITFTNAASAAVNYAEVLGSLTHSSGRLNIVSATANSAGATQTLTLTGLSQSGTGTVAISAGGGLNTNTNQVKVTGAGSSAAGTIIGPWLTVGTSAGAQTDYGIYSNDAILPLNATSTATLGAFATYDPANNLNVALTATQTLAANTFLNTLRYTGTSNQGLTLNATLGTYGILHGGTSTLTITAGTGALTLPDVTPGNLYLAPHGGNLSITAAITDNTATGILTLVQAGTGTTTLSGTNTFSGGLVVNSGTLTVANTGTVLGNVNNTIAFNGPATFTNNAAGTIASTHAVQLNNGAIVSIANSANAVNIAGVISGTGGITSTQTAGTALTLSGLNTYTGPTNVTTGTLKAGAATTGADGAFGSNSAVTLANTAGVILDITGFNNSIGSLSGGGTSGGTVQLGAATLTVGGNNEPTSFVGGIVGTGSLTKTGTGVLTLLPQINATTTAASTASTTLTVPTAALAAGMPVTGPGIPAGTTVASITNGTTLVLSQAVTVPNGAAISFASGYSGATNLNGGLVNIANLAGLGMGSAINIGGGGVQWAQNTGLFSYFSPDISTRTVTLTGTGGMFDTNSQQINFANSIGNNGTGGLTKLGLGTLALQAANTYTGATNVAAGVLRLENAQALGTGTAGVTVANGAALVLAGGGNFGTNPITLNGAGSFGAFQNGALVNASGSSQYNGQLTLASSSTIAVDGGSLSLGSIGAVSGAGFDLTLAGSGNGSLAGGLQTASGKLIKNGSGTWTLSGAGTFTGTTMINAGTLALDLGTNPTGVLGSTSNLTINGGTLSVSGGASFSTQTLGTLNLGAGAAATVQLVPNGASTTLALTGGAWSRGAGCTVLFDYSSANAGARQATVSAVPTGTGGATGLNNVLGYAQVKDSSGVTGMAYIDGSNNIARLDIPMMSLLQDSSNSATTDYTTSLVNTSPLNWSNGITSRAVNSLTFDTTNNAQTVHMGATGNVLTISSGALQFIGANDATLLGGQAGANDSELIVHQNGTGDFTIQSAISSGLGSLTKDGAGTLILAPIVSQTGTTNGTTTVSVADSSALAVGQLVSGGGIPAGTTIASIVNGTTITLSAPATTGATGALTFGSGNAYSGATLVNAGTLKAGSAGAFSSNSAVTLANGATLDTGGFSQTLSSINASGNVVLTGNSVLDIGGANTDFQNISQTNSRSALAGVVSGTGSLALNGGANLALANNANTFSGEVNVNSGVLTVSNIGQLGNSPLISVNGVSSGAGFPGGVLVLQGGASGLTFNKNLNISGRGPANQNTVSLVSIGGNTFTGTVTTSAITETRVAAALGNTVFSTGSILNLGANAGNGFLMTGNGNFFLNGQVSGGVAGQPSLYRFQTTQMTGTTVLNNWNGTFASDIRVDAGFLRVGSGAAFGFATAAGNASKLRGSNTAGFEIRTDLPTSFSNISGTGSDTQIGFFLDRAVGGAGLGTEVVSAAGIPGYATTAGNVTFGEMLIGTGGSRTITLAGRDGYGSSWGGGADGLIATQTNGSPAITNNSNGVVFVDGSAAVSSDGTARTFTVNSLGETVLTGFVRQGTGAGLTVFAKGSAGTLVLTGANSVAGTSSTFNMSTNVNAGTLLLSGAGATIGGASGGVLNGVAGGALQLGNSGTFSALDYRSTGESTAKVINLQGTTGAGIVLANQAGATPLVFSSAVGASGAGIKNFYLGGSNTAANEIAGVITDNTGTNKTSLVKFGSGTWLYDPAPATYATSASIAWLSGGGASQNTFSVAAGTTGIVPGMTVSGNNTSGVVTAYNQATGLVTISNNIGTAMAAGNVTFSALGNFTGGVTVTGGTLQVKPTALTGNGANLFTTAQALTFNADGGISNGFAGGTFQLATPGVTFTANQAQTLGALTPTAGSGKIQVDAGTGGFSNILNFASLGTRGAGATLSFLPAASGAGIQFAAATGANGVINGYSIITNPATGAVDFVANAAVNTNIAAATYTGLPTTATTSTVNYSVASSLTTGQADAVNTLKMIGGATATALTLGGNLTFTTNPGGLLFDNSAGAGSISGAFSVGTAAQELVVTTAGTSPANALTINSVLGNTTGNFTKGGSGTLVLTGANTFTGNAFITEGTLKLGGTTASTLGTISTAANVTTIRQNATLDVNNSGASAAPFTGATALNTTTIGVLAGTGTIDNTNAAASAISLGLNGTSTGTQNFAGVIQNSGGTLTVIKGGTSASIQSFTGLNTYTGATVIKTGTLQVNSLANGGVPSSIGASSNAASNLVFAGGTLQYTGNTTTGTNIYQTTQTPSVSIDRLFTLDGNATIDSSGTYGNVVAAARAANNAALVFNNTGAVAFASSGAKTLTLQGDSFGDNEIALQLVDNGASALSLTKSGTGLWVLSNPNNSYSGPTTITGGVLRAQSSNSTATSGSTIGATNASNILNVDTTQGLVVGQTVSGTGITGTPTIAAVLDGNHIQLSSSQTVANNTALSFGNITTLSANSNLRLAGGVLEMAGSFSRAIGTGANQVQWTDAAGTASNVSGGFAASSSKLTVNFGGANAPVNFGGGPGGVGNLTGNLILSSATALSDVEVTNPINLNGAIRTIQVDDNTSTTTDFATVSGVISGSTGSGLTKSGGGLLILGGNNTYAGNTFHTNGQLAITSFGGGSTAASSLGNGSGILFLGSGTNTSALLYTGSGETVNREINLTSTTGSVVIDNTGSGPLVLPNVFNSVAGAKTLTLRGQNADANILSANLADNGGALGLSKQDGGTWFITGNNAISGVVSIGAGWVGINSTSTGVGANPLGTGQIQFSNAGIFATNAGGLTINNPIQINANTAAMFTGQNSINLVGSGATPIVFQSGNPWTFTNTIAAPATLTITGAITSTDTTARVLTFQGTGNTIVNTGIPAGGAAITPNISTSGTVTFNAANAQTGGLTMTQGTLIANAATPFGTAGTVTLLGGVLQLSTPGAVSAATVSLNGNGTNSPNAAFPTVTGSNAFNIGTLQINIGANSSTTRSLFNNLTGAGITVSTSVNLMQSGTGAGTLFLGGSGAYTFNGATTNGTGGAGVLTYNGTGSLTLTADNAHTGQTNFNSGTINLTGNGRLGTTSATVVSHGAVLNLNNNASGNPTVADRLGNKPLTMAGATLNFTGLATTGSAEGTAGGTLAFNAGESTVNLVNNGGTTAMNFTTLTTNTGAFVNFTSNAAFGSASKVIFSTAPTLTPATTGILARDAVNGLDFATYAAGTGITAFSNYNAGGAYTNINSAAATDTLKIGTGFITNSALTVSKTVNALNLADAGNLTVSMLNGNDATLTLTSGGLFASGGGTHSITVPRVALGAEGALHIASGTTLNMAGTFLGTTGLNKNLGGILSLNGQQFYTGQTTVNNGTLNINGGVSNSLFPGQALSVNNAGVLNLNGNNQYVGTLSGGTNPGSGGTINLGSANLVTNMTGNGTFAGALTGTGGLARVGGNTLTVETPLAYTGPTVLMGGVMTLRDNATLLNTSAITLNYANLLLDNNANLQTNLNDRVNDTAPITLRGGSLTYTARASTFSSETLGAVSAAQGANSLTANANGNFTGNYGMSDLTFASFSRSPGATVNFGGTNLGSEGASARILFTNPAGLGYNSNFVLPAWAIVNSDTYAGYNPSQGVGALNTGGFQGYVSGYTANGLVFGFAGGTGGAPGNVTNILATAAVTTTLPAGTTTTGMLRLAGAFQNDLAFTTANDVLDLEQGGLLRANVNNPTTIGTAALPGVLTAGTATSGNTELVIYGNQSTITVNSAIKDPSATAIGGTGTVTLIKGGANTLTLQSANSYTGGTVVNQGTLNLSATAGSVVIPAGGLTINGGVQGAGTAVTMNTNAGQIDPSNAVTINGRGTLTLVGNNTLNSVTFNNNGGEGAPTVATGGVLTLGSNSPVTVTSSNASQLPVISGAGLALASGTNTLSIGAIQSLGSTYTAIQPSLNISAPITGTGAAISKTGAGLLQLSGTNTFTGNFNIAAGGVVLGADSSPTQGGTTFFSSPLGLGSVTVADGARILVDGGANRNLGNNITFAGNPIFDNVQAGTTRTLALNGTITVPNGALTISIPTPFLNVSMLGKFTNASSITSITKTGLGGLLFNTDGYTGAINFLNTGVLSLVGDGNGSGLQETLPLGALTFDSASVPTLTIGRAGGTLPFTAAQNKTFAPSSVTSLASGLNLTNNNGYGLLVADNMPLTNGALFTVSAASASNAVQGLTLSGVLSGASVASGAVALTKAGAGALVLTNSGNTFGATGAIIDVTGGILQVPSDGALGNAGNIVRISTNSTSQGLRLAGTGNFAHTINLNNVSSAIDVTTGNVATLTSPFTLSATTSQLFKNDNGVLELSVSNSASNWSNTTAGITINAGAVRLSQNNAAGLATNKIVVNAAIGAALQLSGGVNIPNPIVLNNVANETLRGGLASGGHLQSVSGNNTVSGIVATVFDAEIGANAGSTLNITGGIDNTGNRQITFVGAGTINLASAISLPGFQINKYGAGTTNVTTAQTATFGNSTGAGLQINAGTVSFNLNGTLPSAAVGGINVNPTGTLEFDNTTTNISNRLAGSSLTFNGGSFVYNGASNNSGENSTINALTVNSGGANLITLNPSGSATVSLNFGSFGQGSDSSFILAGNGIGTASNKITFTTAPTTIPATSGILGRGIIGAGFDFVSYNHTGTAANTNGLQAFTAYNATAGSATNINTAGATDTSLVTSAMTTTNLTAGKTINAVKFSGNNLSLGGNALTTLTLSAAAVAATGGTSNLNVPITAFAGNQAIFHVDNASTLNANGILTGTAGVVKADAGTLVLNPPTNLAGVPNITGNFGLTGTVNINGGTLQLGKDNAITPNSNVRLAPGATFDLAGKMQYVAILLTNTNIAELTPGALGVVTSSTGTGNLIINQDTNARSWGAEIQGAVNFTRSGQNTFSIFSNQPYTGSTVLNAGTTLLREGGALSGTSAIDLNYATLQLDNNTGMTDSANRINDAAPITMRGATLNFVGRTLTASTETLGNLSVAQGFNIITPSINGTGIASADLTLGSLSQVAGSGSTLLINATAGQIGSNPRVMATTLNGVATGSTYGAGLTNNIIGGWAEVGNEFASYVPGLGIIALNATGGPAYDYTTIPAGNYATKNARITGSTTVPAGGSVLNALTMSGTINLSFTNATDTLNLASGGLIGPNNNQMIGASVDSGRLTAGGLTPAANSDLYLYNRANTLTLNSRIVDNPAGSGSSVRAVLTASGGAITMANPNHSYTGGTILNGGTLNLNNATAGTYIPLAANPANGLVINGGTVTMSNTAGQIAAGNIVTLNGSSLLNLFGNNTLQGIVFNSLGGTANPTVTTFSVASATGAGSTGVLTVGSSGITVVNQQVGLIPFIEGRVDLGTSLNTVNVGSFDVNGATDVASVQRAFLLRGITGTSGGFNKTGAGVLELGAQNNFTGPVNVLAGALRSGVTNAGSRFSALTIAPGARYDVNNASTTWGSLAGGGVIFNSNFGGSSAVLSAGFDNSDTTFSGTFQRVTDAQLGSFNFQKVGAGTLSLTGTQSTANGITGTVTVSGGTLAFAQGGAWFTGTTTPAFAGTFNINAGGTLLLDNSGATNINNRLGLGATGTLNMQGGTLQIKGNSSVATSEVINSYTVANGGGTLQLQPNANQPLTVTITTLGNTNSTGSQLFQGINGAVAGNGQASLSIGTNNLQASQGGGNNGTSNMSIRADILADASSTGLGTGFLVKDTATNLYRALGTSSAGVAVPGEFNTTPGTWATAQNAAINGIAQTISVNAAANSLTVSGTASLSNALSTAAFGQYGANGAPLTLTNNTSSVLVLNNGAFTNNVSFNGTAGNTLTVHTVGNAVYNQNGFFGIGNTQGLVKADGGTFNLNNRAFFTGNLVINGGAMNLASGVDNTIAVVPTTGAPTLNNLSVNGPGASLDLGGNNQAFGSIASINPLPGNGGTITNASATPATLTSISGGTFAGQLNGNLNFTRAGNNTTLLTNESNYTGATVVRGGTLQLRDSGSVASSSSLTLNHGTLNWDNFGLNPLGNLTPTRVAATAPVTMQGGTFTINGGGSSDTVVALNSVTIAGGNNNINTLPFLNEGSTIKLTIGNLTRNPANHSGINFNGFSQNNNSTGLNTLGGQGLIQNSNIIISQLNGAPFTSANLTNGIIGGWAVADGSTFATYSDTFGVVAMGNTYGGFTSTGFTGTDISAATVATGNYNDGTSRTLTTGVKAANSWRMAPSAAQTITPVSGTTWTFGTGIITNAAQTITVAAADATNTISGPAGGDLYFYINQGTTVINPAIIGSSSLVSNGPNTLRLAPSFASNTYSGGTFVQNGALNLQAATGLVAIPGALTITSSSSSAGTTVTLGNATAGQIAPTSAVTFNGGSTLTLFNYTTATTQTLDSLTFNNDGGAINPALAFGTPTALSTIILSNANPLTATNNSLATTPVISTSAATLSALQFSAATPTITVNAGQALTGLNIAVPITQNAGMTGAITKAGAGALALSGASTFTTGLNLTGGSIIFGANSTPTTGTVTSGPLGTGTLTIGDGTTILNDNSARTLANAVTVAGDFTIGGVGSTLTLNGPVALGAAGRSITVTSPAVTATLGGALTSTATGTALTKAGAGTLILGSASNSFGGAGVAVTGGVLKPGVAGAYPATSPLSLSAGAGFDMNNLGLALVQLSGAGFLTNSGASAQALVLGGTAAADVTSNANSSFDGVIANAAGAVSVTKAGLGTTALNGPNAYTGATTINAGVLRIGHNTALGTTAAGTTIVGNSTNSGRLELAGNITVAEPITIEARQGANADVVALSNFSGNNTITSQISTSTGGGEWNIESQAGTLTLAGGLTPIAAATGGRNLKFSGAGDLAVTGALLQNLATMSVIKNGAGTLSLFGPNNYSGGTVINGGTVQINSASSLGTAAATINAGTLQATQDITSALNFTLGSASSAIAVDASKTYTLTGILSGAAGSLNKGGAGTLVLTGANTYAGDTIINGGTLQVGGGGTTGSIANTTLIMVNSGGTLAFNRSDSITFAKQIVGTGNLSNIGANNLVLSNATNSYSGLTTVASGAEITVTADNALGATSQGTIVQNGGSLRIGTLYTAAEPVTLSGAGRASAGALALGTGVSTASFAGPLTITGGGATINTTTDVSAATGKLTLSGGIDTTAATTTFAGTGEVIVSGAISGTAGDVVVDSAKLRFQAGATYGGATIVQSGGFIYSETANALPGATILTLNNGTFDLSGFNQSIAGLADGGAGTRTVTNSGAATANLTITGTSNFGGTIVDGASTTALTVGGTSSTVTLTGANTYTGGTTINFGNTLSVGSGGATGSIAGDVTNNGALAFNRTGTVTYGGIISGSGSLQKQGSGTLVFNGANNATGETRVQAGTLELHGSISGNVRIDSVGTFDVTNLPGGFHVATGGFLYNDGAVTGSVNTDGTVAGIGTISGSLTANSGGTVSPGNSVGTLDVAGALAMNAGSMLNIELSGNPLALSDRLIASSVSLSTVAPGVTLNLSLLPNSTLESNGAIFFIVSNTGAGSVTGSFANSTTAMSFGADFGGETFNVLDSPTGANGAQFAISYDANLALGQFHGGNDIALMAVPEPGSAATLALGVSAIAGLKRFRRRKA